MQTTSQPRPALLRSADDSILAGVCSGLATHLGLPVFWVRFAMAITGFFGGAGVILYIFLFLTVPKVGETISVVPMRRVFTKPSGSQASAPTAATSTATTPVTTPAEPGSETPKTAAAPKSESEPALESESKNHGQSANDQSDKVQTANLQSANGAQVSATPKQPRVPVAEILLGVSFLVAGLTLVAVQLGVHLPTEVILPGLAVLVGIGLTWWLIADRARPERLLLPRVLAALALVAVGALMFFITAEEPNVITVISAALAVLAGVGLAIMPWILRINRELVAERTARARETERAEIAAHLHDSVLQTLALIQQRSEPGTEVARIARGQERELRDWLFQTADQASSGASSGTATVDQPAHSIATVLESHAASLEEDHAVRFEVVAVGERATAPEPIVAAAREAMLNAARHAGGDVTVYIETTAKDFNVDISDRGPGFKLDEIVESRFGVRESIIGRMNRAGGSAKILGGPGGQGVSVRLTIARPNDTKVNSNQDEVIK